jgi:hypothetical protein
MHKALWKLLSLQTRARLRRWGRGLKTTRGAVLTGAGVMCFAFWIVPAVIQGLAMERSNPAIMRTNLSLGLLAMCVANLLFSGGGKAVVFSPAEVDFLFPGPFPRRELLVYKLVGSLATAAFMGLLFGTVFLRYVSWWAAAVIGIFAAYLFILLFDMALAMTLEWIGELTYNRTRRLVALAAIVLVALALVPAVTQAQGEGLGGFVAGLRSSIAGQVVLAPFDVFSRAITAERLWPDVPLWAGLALAIDLVLIGLILRLDANYQEASYVASQKRYETMQRARSGGGAVKMTAGWRLPAFPRLAGAGAVARRQAIHLLRSSPRLLLVLVLMTLGFWPTLYFSEGGAQSVAMVLGILAWANFMLVMMFPYGFRGDLDYFDTLKTLPLRPLAIVAGESLPLALLLATLNGIVLIGLLAASQDYRQAAGIAAALNLPIVALVVTMENLLFLAFPFRQVPGQADPQQMGRLMLLMFFRMIVIFIVAALAMGVGALAYFVAGESWTAATIAVATMLLSMTAILLWLAAVLFERFDVSVDTPA